jgi:Peptidase family M23
MLLPRDIPQLKNPALRCCLVLALLVGAWMPAFAGQTIRCTLADGFDYPVGKPEARGYHKARGFYPNGHLGEDWNGDGGGDTDLNDPIYSTARGVVVFSENVHVGWGNMIIIRHAYRESDGRISMVDSLYGHLEQRKANVGEIVERGQLIGLMGGNSGMYPVHLHFEIHKNLTMGPNRTGFAHDYSNYYSPTPFINAHRQLPADYTRYDIPMNTFAPYGKSLSDEQIAAGQRLNLPVGTAKPPTVANATVPPGGKGLPTVNLNKIKPGTPKSETEAPQAAPPKESKGDFWSRLRNKLSKGEVTGGIDAKKP